MQPPLVCLAQPSNRPHGRLPGPNTTLSLLFSESLFDGDTAIAVRFTLYRSRHESTFGVYFPLHMRRIYQPLSAVTPRYSIAINAPEALFRPLSPAVKTIFPQKGQHDILYDKILELTSSRRQVDFAIVGRTLTSALTYRIDRPIGFSRSCRRDLSLEVKRNVVRLLLWGSTEYPCVFSRLRSPFICRPHAAALRFVPGWREIVLETYAFSYVQTGQVRSPARLYNAIHPESRGFWPGLAEKLTEVVVPSAVSLIEPRGRPREEISKILERRETWKKILLIVCPTLRFLGLPDDFFQAVFHVVVEMPSLTAVAFTNCSSLSEVLFLACRLPRITCLRISSMDYIPNDWQGVFPMKLQELFISDTFIDQRFLRWIKKSTEKAKTLAFRRVGFDEVGFLGNILWNARSTLTNVVVLACFNVPRLETLVVLPFLRVCIFEQRDVGEGILTATIRPGGTRSGVLVVANVRDSDKYARMQEIRRAGITGWKEIIDLGWDLHFVRVFRSNFMVNSFLSTMYRRRTSPKKPQLVSTHNEESLMNSATRRRITPARREGRRRVSFKPQPFISLSKLRGYPNQPFNFTRTLKRVVAAEEDRFKRYEIELDADDQAPETPRHGVQYYTDEDLLNSMASAKPIQYLRGLDAQIVTSCGYSVGKLKSAQDDAHRQLPLHDLLKNYQRLGYRYVAWDGVTPRPILDWDGRVIAVLAGQPDDPEYVEACRAAFLVINQEGDQAHFLDKHLEHKRGQFPAVNVGVTHGKGTKVPINCQNEQLDVAMARLLQHPSLERISSFQDAAFKAWAPDLYAYYEQTLSQIWKRYPALKPGFANSVWPCTAFNFGKRVWTKPHRDCKNLSFGWCSVVALGTFDPKKGGHLVLPDLRMIIEFPSGSNILIPSALLTHCNIPLPETEERLSFTQFCAGDLFRFVDAGLRTESQLKDRDPGEYETLQVRKKTRWSEGLAKFKVMKKLNSC